MAMANFLPSDYKAPRTSGNYMKLQDGENKIRILSAPVIGWEDWTADNKPVRFRYADRPKAPIDPERPIKHFWAFVVWNYVESRIQILQINQATVRDALETLSKDADWGLPYFYDVKIVKSGEKINTKYNVVALPHKPVSDIVKAAFYEERIDLNALFDGADPFAPSDCQTEGVFEKHEEEADGYSQDIKRRFEMCSQTFKESIYAFLTKNKLKSDFSDLPEELLERINKKINSELEPKAVEKS